MNVEMAYLVGMILGNGEIQRGTDKTTVTIDIPYKKLEDDEGKEISVYVKASIVDIRTIIEPLIGSDLIISQTRNSTIMSFTKRNEDYTMREILRFISGGIHHKTMYMSDELFDITNDEKKELLRGIADVTGHIRRSNHYFNKKEHRVYIEIPGNWKLVIQICNLLKDVDVPVMTIDFGHPNFRDSNREMYDKGNYDYWKKEHQIKIWANEFLAIGFNIEHKQRALEKYAKELLEIRDKMSTHKYYWEGRVVRKSKPIHPGENDSSLPDIIRGKHYESWKDLARELGYHE